jgi:hypothetical protein
MDRTPPIASASTGSDREAPSRRVGENLSLSAACNEARSVLIATPCFGGLLTQAYVQSLVALLAGLQRPAPAEPQTAFTLRTHQDSLITRARNSLFTAFLDGPDYTHLLFIDADIGWQPAQIQRMLDFGEDIVAGVYPLKTYDWERVAQRAGSPGTGEQLREAGLGYVGVTCVGAEQEERDGFVTAHYAGAGFLLIRRAAALRLVEAYPETRYVAAHNHEPPSGNRYDLFGCVIEPETGHYLSEDFAFCHRWRKIGGRIWLDVRSRLRHVGSYEFQGVPLSASVPLVAPQP